MSTTQPILQPCPFCGGEAKLTKHEHSSSPLQDEYIIQCDNVKCLATSYASEIVGINPDDVAIKFVTQAWNTRALSTPSEQGKTVEEIERLLYEHLPITMQDGAVRQLLLFLESHDLTIASKRQSLQPADSSILEHTQTSGENP